jgi:type I restriction enzyme M protein
MFYQWIANAINKPYNSYGNGALMRISPVAKYAVKHNLSIDKALEIAEQITSVTHNHPEALLAVKIYIEILIELLINKNLLLQ